MEDPKEILGFAEAVEQGIKTLREVKPTIYKPIRGFAIEKSAETIANLALKSYNEFHETAPILSVENHPAFQSLLTTGEDIRDVVAKARKDFVDKAVKDGVLSESEAKNQAKKLIGATWDVGHINMMRKYGYDDEEIIKQTKAVA